VPDAGLKELQELTTLKFINLTSTEVTAKGTKALQAALLGLEVLR